MGLHGLLAYGVARRTREIGVRMALGASPGSVIRMILREVVALTLAGIAIGIPFAIAAGHDAPDCHLSPQQTLTWNGSTGEWDFYRPFHFEDCNVAGIKRSGYFHVPKVRERERHSPAQTEIPERSRHSGLAMRSTPADDPRTPRAIALKFRLVSLHV